jgi:hypothetical protein
MPIFVAVAVAGLFVCLGLIHLYWGLGGRIAVAAAIPEINGKPAFTPSRTATFLVAVGLFGAGYVISVAGHIVASPIGPFSRLMAFALSALFLARAVGDFRLVGFFKRVRTSRFAKMDTVFYSPLCLSLSLGTGFVAYWSA